MASEQEINRMVNEAQEHADEGVVGIKTKKLRHLSELFFDQIIAVLWVLAPTNPYRVSLQVPRRLFLPKGV
jgi:hypothetical protein